MATQCSYATAIGRQIYPVRLIADASIKECETNKVQNSSRHCSQISFQTFFSDILRFKKEIKLISVLITFMVFYIVSVFPASDSRSQAILSLSRRFKRCIKIQMTSQTRLLDSCHLYICRFFSVFQPFLSLHSCL